MLVLLAGMLFGGALVAAVAVLRQRQLVVIAAGLVLLLIAGGTIATAPTSQMLRLAFPLLRSPESPAWAVLCVLAGLATFGGAALGWGVRALAVSPPAGPATGTAPPDPWDPAVIRAAERARWLREALSVLGPCLVLALAASAFGRIGIPRASLIGLFTAGTILAIVEWREAMHDGLPEFRSNWGGLGGGLGGWELSRSAVLLVVALAFAGAALVAAVGPFPAPPAGPAVNGAQHQQDHGTEARKPAGDS